MLANLSQEVLSYMQCSAFLLPADWLVIDRLQWLGYSHNIFEILLMPAKKQATHCWPSAKRFRFNPQKCIILRGRS